MGSDRLICSLIAILLTVLAIVVLATGSHAWRLIESDDFTGADGSAPDPANWTVVHTDPDDHVRIAGNTLKTHAQGNGYAFVRSINNFTTANVTLLVDYKMTVAQGRSIDVGLVSNDSGTSRPWVTVTYDADAGYGTINYRNNNRDRQFRYNQDYVLDRWYTVNITIRVDRFNVTIKERTSGNVFLSYWDHDCDPFGSDNSVAIGVYQYHSNLRAEALFDNYHLYNLTVPPKMPPVWGPLPALHAVEDVPFTYDFSGNVSDPDDMLRDLSIDSPSQYVTFISRFEVTFLFPNNVTNASVPLELSDGGRTALTAVEFVIRPVNDAPLHDIPGELQAVEDEALTMDLTAHVWDVDNETSDLFLVLDDPYATADGLNLTVTFPEGVLGHNLTFLVSDGINGTGVTINFTVQPVDDPPTIDPLGEFVVTEDQDSVLDIAPFLHDPDTPVGELVVLARDPNCTVEGFELHFLVTMGGVRYTVKIEVTDASGMGEAYLDVIVQEVNDAPVIAGIGQKLFIEDQAKSVDLTIYISDEDNTSEELTLECDHPAVVGIEGFILTMNYTTEVPDHVLIISVFDGQLRDESRFSVHVQPVNDPPTIVGLDHMRPPLVLDLDEGTELVMGIIVDDEDDVLFDYRVESTWAGVTASSDGTLHVVAGKGEVGDYTVTLVVEDSGGSEAREEVTIHVIDVNDPPAPPVITGPVNHSVHEAGVNITFGVNVSDPDIAHGQVLTVTWRSNISDVLFVKTTDGVLEFTTATLPVGIHRITVSVTDGEHVRDAWIELEVTEPYVPNKKDDDDDRPSFLTSGTGLWLLMVAALVIVAVVIALSRRSR